MRCNYAPEPNLKERAETLSVDAERRFKGLLDEDG